MSNTKNMMIRFSLFLFFLLFFKTAYPCECGSRTHDIAHFDIYLHNVIQKVRVKDVFGFSDSLYFVRVEVLESFKGEKVDTFIINGLNTSCALNIQPEEEWIFLSNMIDKEYYGVTYCSKSFKIDKLDANFNEILNFLRFPETFDDEVVYEFFEIDKPVDFEKLKFFVESVNDKHFRKKKTFVSAILQEDGSLSELSPYYPKDSEMSLLHYELELKELRLKPATIKGHPVKCRIVFYVYTSGV